MTVQNDLVWRMLGVLCIASKIGREAPLKNVDMRAVLPEQDRLQTDGEVLQRRPRLVDLVEKLVGQGRGRLLAWGQPRKSALAVGGPRY